MENGGWTVIQRRLNGSVDFYRNWTEYAQGFGDTGREHWIGLDNIHYLTQEPSELYISMETFGDVTPEAGYAWYSFFSVDNSSLFYRLNVEINGYKGNVNDCVHAVHNRMYFSTYDRDNDIWKTNCAASTHGAWWYADCLLSNLNGKYLAGRHSSFTWYDPWGYYFSLKTITMKVRRA